MAPGLGAGGGRAPVSMEQPRRRGTERCPKCRVNMEVYLTYHRCPTCGREQRKATSINRERQSLDEQQMPPFIQRLRESMLAPSRVSATPSSREFMDLEPSGQLAVERFLLWCLLGATVWLILLPTLLQAEPQPLAYTWGSPLLFLWLPALFSLAAMGAVLHNSPLYRHRMLWACAGAALLCLLIAIFALRSFATELYAVYPHLQRIVLIGRRGYNLLTAPGADVWLWLHGCFWALCAWHIRHEERQLGRL
ncbi:MAG: hypothetical protein R3F46_00825 [bacterium]